MTKPNPPIKGHELIGEGNVWPKYDYATDEYIGTVGGCRCGLMPDDYTAWSMNERKRWHRQHKAELREADQ